VSSRKIPTSASWADLAGVFYDQELSDCFEILEKKYDVSNETHFFSGLVNMSSASKEPFHRWVRYREGYAGELVKEILRRYPINCDKFFLMDPMCGSGSSLVAAKQIGIDSIGLDVNGYAVLAANVKGACYSENDLCDIRKSIDEFLASPVETVLIEDSLAEIAKYFPVTNFQALCWIKKWLSDRVIGKTSRDFFSLALLAILEDCSDRKKDGNGLATRPAPISNPKARMIDQLELMFCDISSNGSKRVASALAYDCSALQLGVACKRMFDTSNKILGSIIFSPPYANSFDYFESYKLELIFGGYTTVGQMTAARERLIRNYRITKPRPVEKSLKTVEMISSEILSRIPEKEAETGVRDGRTRLVPNMLRGYFEDMGIVLEEGYRNLAPGGLMHIVVDQSAYVGVPIPTDLILAAIGESSGFAVEGIINCRRANTSGQQLRKFPYLKHLLRESIVSLRKPH